MFMEKVTADTKPVANKQYLCTAGNWREEALSHCPQK